MSQISSSRGRHIAGVTSFINTTTAGQAGQ
jgi:hypothetical protein